MAGRIRVNWLVAALGVALAALLAYAWYDGGEQPLRAMTAETTLPRVVQ